MYVISDVKKLALTCTVIILYNELREILLAYTQALGTTSTPVDTYRQIRPPQNLRKPMQRNVWRRKQLD